MDRQNNMNKSVDDDDGEDTVKDIWVAAQNASNKMKEERLKYFGTLNQFTIVFVGHANSGKSTLIYKFLESRDKPKPTAALNYWYIKRMKGLNSGYEVCNIWEIGGETYDSALFSIPITLKTIKSSALLLVIDLTKLSNLISLINDILEPVRNHIIDLMFSEQGQQCGLEDYLKQNAFARLIPNVGRVQDLNLFPIPLLIIGTHFKCFEMFEIGMREAACNFLRMVNLINGGYLQFVDQDLEPQINKLRSTLNNLAFGSQSYKKAVISMDEPLYIPFGSDDVDSFIGSNGHSVFEIYEETKKIFIKEFPQLLVETEYQDFIKDPNFKERKIDEVIELKELECSALQYQYEINSERFIKEMEYK